MKKIAFTLYVFAIIIMVPLCMVVELNQGLKIKPENNIQVSVFEQAGKNPPEASEKSKLQKKTEPLVYSFPLTIYN